MARVNATTPPMLVGNDGIKAVLTNSLNMVYSAVSHSDTARARHIDCLLNAHSAAVMGNILTPQLGGESSEHLSWDADAWVREQSKTVVYALISSDEIPISYSDYESVDTAVKKALKPVVVDLLRELHYTMSEAVNELGSNQTEFVHYLNSSSNQGGSGEHTLKASNEAVKSASENVVTSKEAVLKKISSLHAAAEEAVNYGKLSMRDARIKDAYNTALSAVCSLAAQLAVNQKAQSAIQRKKDSMRQEAGTSDDGIVTLFMSPQYIALNSGIKDEQSATRVLVEKHVKDTVGSFPTKSKDEKSARTLQFEKVITSGDAMEVEVGEDQINRMEKYLKSPNGHETLWALYPVLMRIGQDVPSHSDLHWQPPKAHDDERHASDLNDHYDLQSQALALMIKNSVDTLTWNYLTSVIKHGETRREVQAAEDDGPTLYWVLLQRIHPITRASRQRVADELYEVSASFAEAEGNLTHLLETARICLGLAYKHRANIEWERSGKVIAEGILASPSAGLYSSELQEFRNLTVQNEGACDSLSSMLATITITNSNHWSTRATSQAKLAKTKKPDPNRRGKESNSKPRGKSNMGKKAGSGDTTNAHSDPSLCQVIECNRKIQNFRKHPSWKLCSTCMLESCTDKKSFKLRDGSTWEYRDKSHKSKAMAAQVKMMLSNSKSYGLGRKHEDGFQSYLGKSSQKRSREKDQNKAAAAKAANKAKKRAKKAAAVDRDERQDKERSDDGDDGDDGDDDDEEEFPMGESSQVSNKARFSQEARRKKLMKLKKNPAAAKGVRDY